MRIIIPCTPFDGGKSGISVYIKSVVAALTAAGHDLTLVVEAGDESHFAGHKIITIPRWCCKPILSMLWHLFWLPRIIRKSGCQCCIMPAANRRITATYPIYTIAVVHDLSQYHVKAKYDPLRTFYIKQLLPYYVRKAPAVLAISRSTAGDLTHFWRIPKNKITVAYNGVTPTPHSTPSNATPLPTQQPYLLYVSRLEHPGKNHCRLIDAYSQLSPQTAAKFHLVIAGADWFGADKIHHHAQQSPYAQNIHFTGFVSAQRMHQLYANAAGYIFPSLFEGFGLSLIEAMNYAIPCACSNTSSLGELGRNAALLFNPEDVSDIRRAMVTLMTNQPLRRRLVAAGLRKGREFTWERHIHAMEEIFRKGLRAMPPAQINGITINNCTMEQAVTHLQQLVQQGHSTGQCPLALFVNAHCINVAAKDEEYRRILQKADAVWPDGSGIHLAGRLLGFPVPENVNGTDMYPLLAQSGMSIYLLGAAPGVANEAMNRTRQQFPQSNIVGAHHGFFASKEEESAVIQEINRLKPDLLLVALGVPRQEKWLQANRRHLQCGAALAVGGLLDFVSQRIPRAPKWLRRIGMEWIYRLKNEPIRLFKRYIIGNPLFVARILLERHRRKKDHTPVR